jgi:16S rRNA G1207 methylase RsmC
VTGPAIQSWLVNADPDQGPAGVGRIVLAADRLPADRDPAAPVLGLHQAMREPLPVAEQAVDIAVPEYRGKAMIPVLGWLVANRLAGPAALVSWRMTSRQGPDSIHRLLTGLGWQLKRRREAGRIVLAGSPPDRDRLTLPGPARFTAQLGTASLELAADYGVFSPRTVDDGTRLLFEMVRRRSTPVSSLADIGIGYGALALGLVRNGQAGEAVATDVDCVALWLAQLNAAAAGVALSLTCTADPREIAETELTVCNVPTHIDQAQSAALMSGLIARARYGRLQIVVHTALERRYLSYLTDAGLRVVTDRGPKHVVLTADG